MVSFALFLPLVIAGVLVAILFVAASVVETRGTHDQAEKLRDVGFLIGLVSGVWIVVLTILVIFDFPSTFVDMLLVVVIVALFFAALVAALFGVIEVIFSRGPRRRRNTPSEP